MLRIFYIKKSPFLFDAIKGKVFVELKKLFAINSLVHSHKVLSSVMFDALRVKMR